MAKETNKIPCCPELIRDDNCDVLFFTRTLNYPFLYKREMRVSAQLILGFRFSRCTLGLVLGDPAYTVTLLPGEKVRLFTTSRRSKFTYDASTQLSTRSEQMSEESYYMIAAQHYFSNLENSQSGTATETSKGKWDFSGDASSGLGWFSVNASTSSKGSHDSSSTLDYLNTQSSNMKSASSQAVHATHMAHSVSVGEVATRTHAEGQTEDQYESSSKEFSNENNCHALTYIFYRLNKKQVVKFELVSVQVTLTLGASSGKVQPAIPASMRDEILKALKAELTAAGILDKNGEVSKELKSRFGFEIEFSLPTAGIQVKGCLDECNTCEPERERYHKLQNDLLERQIELLEQSQEYRCCPPAPVASDA